LTVRVHIVALDFLAARWLPTNSTTAGIRPGCMHGLGTSEW